MSGQKDFHIRLPSELHTKLKLLSEERGIAQKWLMVSAIEEFIHGGSEAKVDDLKKETFEIKRRLGALRGDVEILGELLSFFIYHWLGYTPRLEKAERASLAVEARERHEKFMEMFARKVTLGELSIGAVLARSGSASENVDDGGEEEEEGR